MCADNLFTAEAQRNAEIRREEIRITNNQTDLELSAGLDVVSPKRSEIANVKPAVSNYRIRKRPFGKWAYLFMFRRSWRSESSLLTKSFRSSFNQNHFSAHNKVQIQMTIGGR